MAWKKNWIKNWNSILKKRNIEKKRSYHTCLCDSSRCFIKTATTTLTRTNWAIRTKTTKKSGAKYGETQQFRRQSSLSSHSSLSVSFIMPFQLSPVAILNNVKNAIPNERKWACSPRPWQGCSSSHSENLWNKGLIGPRLYACGQQMFGVFFYFFIFHFFFWIKKA